MFQALTLLVDWQEGHLAFKKTCCRNSQRFIRRFLGVWTLANYAKAKCWIKVPKLKITLPTCWESDVHRRFRVILYDFTYTDCRCSHVWAVVITVFSWVRGPKPRQVEWHSLYIRYSFPMIQHRHGENCSSCAHLSDCLFLWVDQWSVPSAELAWLWQKK